MAAKRAGVITIDIIGRSTRLQSEATAGSSRLAQLGNAGQLAGRNIGQGMTVGAGGVRRLTGETVKGTEAGARHAITLLHAAEAASALAASHLLASGALAKFTGSAVANVSTADKMLNGYRALRLVLSPTLFTASTIAVGIAAEETIRLVNARAKLIDQQALFAAQNRISFRSVDVLDTTAKVSGGNAGNVRSLYTGLQSEWRNNQAGVQGALDKLGVTGNVGDAAILGRIAAGLHSIADPAKQAEIAVQLFGDQAGTALQELDGRFARSSEAVQKYGIVLDELSRTQIHQFRQDLLDLKSSVSDFSDLTLWWENFKTGTEIVAAAAEDMSKRGIHALDEMISNWLPGMSALKIAALGIPAIGPGILAKPSEIPEAPAVPKLSDQEAERRKQAIATGMLADELVAETEGIRKRRLESTIEGQREVASQASGRAASATAKLKADDTARESDLVRRQANPNVVQTPGLLTPEQRRDYAMEIRSASDLAEVTNMHVRAMEASKAITELLSEKFSSMNIEMRNAAVAASNVGKSEKEKRGAEAEKIVQATRVEIARKQVAETTKPGEPVLAPTPAQIAGALSPQTAARLKDLAVRKLEADAEKNWRTEIQNTMDSIERRIRVQQLLTDAIGKTHQAQEAAKIEGELLEKFPKQFDHPTPEQGKDIERVRQGKASEAESARAQEVAKTNESLKHEIELEQSLGAAQKEGADAVALVNLAYKLRALYAAGLKGEIYDEIRLHDARKANADAAEERSSLESQQETVDKLELQIEGEQALVEAQQKGAEAVREQSLANKLALLDYDSAATKVFDTLSTRTKALEDLKNQVALTKEALATSQAYSDHLQKLNQELGIITQLEHDQGKTRDIEMDRARIEKDIRDTLAKQALATGSLMDGLRAFFTEAEAAAAKPGAVLHDGLEHAVDGISESLTKAITGQKANWGSMFKNVGDEIIRNTLKSGIDKGLGELAKKFPSLHLPVPGAGKTGPTLAANDPGHVIVDNLGNVPGLSVKAQPGTLSPKLPGTVQEAAPRFGDLAKDLDSLFEKHAKQSGVEETWTPGSVPFGLPKLPSGLINRTGAPVSEEENVGYLPPSKGMPPIPSAESKVSYPQFEGKGEQPVGSQTNPFFAVAETRPGTLGPPVPTGEGAGAPLDPAKLAEAILSAVPHFAEGGTVHQPTLGLLGEAGEVEHVIPHSKLPSLSDVPPSGLGDSMSLQGLDIDPLPPAARRVVSAIQSRASVLRTLWHGSSGDFTEIDPSKTKDTGPIAWLSADKEYSSEYGKVRKQTVSFSNPLDLRRQTVSREEGWNRHAEKTVREWVDLFNKKGVKARVLDPDYADEPVRLWDLLHGGDRDFTETTNLGQALRESPYDVMIVKEPKGNQGKLVDAYGILKSEALKSSDSSARQSPAALPSDIPKFAEGGIVNKPTIGLLGEAGTDIVIPDKLLNQQSPLPAALTGSVSRPGARAPVSISPSGSSADPFYVIPKQPLSGQTVPAPRPPVPPVPVPSAAGSRVPLGMTGAEAGIGIANQKARGEGTAAAVFKGAAPALSKLLVNELEELFHKKKPPSPVSQPASTAAPGQPVPPGGRLPSGLINRTGGDVTEGERPTILRGTGGVSNMPDFEDIPPLLSSGGGDIPESLGGIAGTRLPPLTPTGLIDRGPTGKAGDPVHVIQDSSQSSNSPLSGLLSKLPGPIGSLLGQLGQLGGSAGGAASAGAEGASTGIESVTSSISFGGGLATGGIVSPDTAYWVGENGPEPFVPRTAGTVIPNDALTGGGDTHNHTWNVDARGADQGVMARINQGMAMAAQKGAQAGQALAHERSLRTPQLSH